MSTRSDIASRAAIAVAPFAMGVFAVFLIATPWRFFDALVPTPILPLTIVFFWTLYEPQKLPASAVFLIGIFQDILSGGPIGLWSTLYLVVQYAVLSQRAYFLGRAFQVIWMGFAVTAFTAGLIQWLVMGLMAGELLPLRFILIQMLTTVAFYPMIAHVFRDLRRNILVDL